jgi:hypothetical protein
MGMIEMFFGRRTSFQGIIPLTSDQVSLDIGLPIHSFEKLVFISSITTQMVNGVLGEKLEKVDISL